MKLLLLCAAALGQAGCYLALLFLGNLRRHVPETLCIFAVCFLLYLLTLRLLLRNEYPERNAPAARQTFMHSNRYLTAVLGLAVLFRLILWPSIPSLSDDLYRYSWEGRVICSGHNPYALSPDAPELKDLRDMKIFPLVSRPNLSTIYPPVAQLIFATASAVSYSVASMKAIFIFFDLAVLALLLRILTTLGKNPLLSAIYALNPLIVIEFSGSGHLDSAGIFFMILALYFCLKRREKLSAVALAMAFLVKLLPLLLLPIIAHKKKFLSFAFFIIISVAAFLPFISAGQKLFASLSLYTENWMFNGSCYNLLLLFVPDNQTARRIIAALFCLVAAAAYYRFNNINRLEHPEIIFRQCLFILGLLLLFTPIVHPWYVCWVVPLVAVVQNRAWLLFSGLVFASYWVLREFNASGQWQESPAVLLIEYLPLYALLLFDYVQARGKNVHASPI